MSETKPTYTHGGKREGAGRKKNGDYPHRTSIRLSDDQLAYCLRHGGVSETIRQLIDAAIEAEEPAGERGSVE